MKTKPLSVASFFPAHCTSPTRRETFVLKRIRTSRDAAGTTASRPDPAWHSRAARWTGRGIGRSLVPAGAGKSEWTSRCVDIRDDWLACGWVRFICGARSRSGGPRRLAGATHRAFGCGERDSAGHGRVGRGRITSPAGRDTGQISRGHPRDRLRSRVGSRGADRANGREHRVSDRDIFPAKLGELPGVAGRRRRRGMCRGLQCADRGRGFCL